MTHYYLKDGNREKGPFMLDDLKYQRIRPNTLVKVDDGKWQPIAEVADLHFLLKQRGRAGAYSGSGSSIIGQPAADVDPVRNKRVVTIAVAILLLIMGIGMALFFVSAPSR